MIPQALILTATCGLKRDFSGKTNMEEVYWWSWLMSRSAVTISSWLSGLLFFSPQRRDPGKREIYFSFFLIM